VAYTETIEWLNQNSNRNYPFKEGVSRGQNPYKIPNNFIVDMQIKGAIPGRAMFLGSIEVFNNHVDLLLLQDDPYGTLPTITFTIERLGHVKYKEYSTIFDDMFIRIVVDSLDEVMTWGTGTIVSYGLSESEFEPTVLIPSDRTVRITSLKTDSATLFLRGDVELVAGTGITLTQNDNTNQIEIMLTPETPQPDRCSCPPNTPPIMTINGMAPDCDGNFCISGLKILTINPGEECLEIDPNISANDICDIGTGVPGPQGPTGAIGPQGPEGPKGKCSCDPLPIIYMPRVPLTPRFPMIPNYPVPLDDSDMPMSVYTIGAGTTTIPQGVAIVAAHVMKGVSGTKDGESFDTNSMTFVMEYDDIGNIINESSAWQLMECCWDKCQEAGA